MGLENRDYHRDNNPYDGGGQGSYSRRGGGFNIQTTSMVKRIIIATAIVFIGQLLFHDKLTNLLAMDGHLVFKQGQIWRMLTYALVHTERHLLHILFNMWALYMFGREVERIYGSREFLMFYCAAAIFAALVYTAVSVATGRPLAGASVIGASGAVYAVMALYAVHFPKREIYLMMMIPVQIRFLVLLVIISDFVMIKAGEPVGWSCHLGGLAFGFIYHFQGIRLERILGGGLIGNFKQKAKVRKARKRLKVFAPDDQSSSLPELPKETVLSEQLDHVLAKITREGKESLTKSEQAILDEASRLARERKS